MSSKYILAALGLALVKAGEILVAHSEQFNDNDEFVGGVSDARLGLIDNDTTDEPTSQAAPAAPAAPAAQVTPAQIANAELDKDGLPWDSRIHAGTKTKTQKGVWTRRKGLADADFNKVVAELRQQYPGAGTTTTAPAVAPVATAPVAPAAPTVPAVSIPAVVTPYQQFTDWLARNTGEGKSLPASWVNEQFAANGTSLAALATNQEASAQFLEAFRGVLKQMGVAEQ